MENLATVAEGKARFFADKVSRASELKISGCDGRDRTQLRADAEVLRAHLLQGKSIGVAIRYNRFAPKHVKASLYVADIRVNGRLCDKSDLISDLIDYFDVVEGIDYIEQHWAAYVPSDPTPLVLAFGELTRRAEVLRKLASG